MDRIEEIARAIWAANKQVGCSRGFHEGASDSFETAEPRVQDEFRHFARAAYEVMARSDATEAMIRAGREYLFGFGIDDMDNDEVAGIWAAMRDASAQGVV